MKRALITGVTGQDGAYLSKFLLDKGYSVFGTYRRSSSVNFWRLEELGCLGHPKLELVEYDLTDLGSAIYVVNKYKPEEIYNLAAQSFVGVSFEQPTSTTYATGLGCLNLLEAIRHGDRSIKFYQASTSELFGKVVEVPQREDTPFYPRSPYGIAKLYSHWMTINYRESYDIFATSGILFNHESPLRGKEFVTRKITDAAARIALGKLDVLELGNLDSKRDWGYAAEYVEGMWKMMQNNAADTFVLATNRTESVRDFATMAFRAADIDIEWVGEGLQEQGIDRRSGVARVRVNEKFYRPAEVDLLIGDPSKAEHVLGWKAKVTLEELCKKMVDADLRRVEDGKQF
jgi:GDPmannose 4,6-dehydratase